jgi:predicted acetyltransferase
MPELIVPTARLHEAWLASHREWQCIYEDGAGLTGTDEVISPAGFGRWIARLRRSEDRAIPPEPGGVHTTYRWIAEDDRVLGAIALRHELDETHSGHIGYGVRPSQRRRGLATFALARTLVTARELGLDRVLIACMADNVASARTIERCGGVLEEVRDSRWGPVRHYWVKL